MFYIAFRSGNLPKWEENLMEKTINEIKWNQTFDVVVLGFGGAGATAARFAADSGAKVLLTDVAPNGHEGGNTRYSAQLIGTVDDFDEGKKYYKRLTYPMNLDENVIDIFVAGMAGMRDYVQKYLGVKPISVKNDFTSEDFNSAPVDKDVHEYPEYEGYKTYDFTTVHHGLFDAMLWKNLRQQVVDRINSITVWFNSPAEHLIQDPNTRTIIGVQIERHHTLLNIRALNGVVMAMGGFENNKEAIQNYLNANYLVPLGTLFNKGDGIRMAQEVGADLWHMGNYETLGMLHGMSVKVSAGERGQLILGWQDEANGSIMTIADDGSRYFNEAEPNRHGHIYDHGTWSVPHANVHPHLIFDKKQYDQIKKNGNIPIPNFFDKIVKANNLEDLAHLIHAQPSILAQTVRDFNIFVDLGRDYAFNRDVKTMRAFDNGPFYALGLMPNVLNTQGGPRRNSRAEILDTDGKPIPHLYGAGELGGICANQYQGGGNLAECLIFGKIAGENAARSKNDVVDQNSQTQQVQKQEINMTTEVNEHRNVVIDNNDLINNEDFSNIKLDDNQYLGVSDSGMGGKIVVKITYKGDLLSNVEVVKQSETNEVGGKAIREIPAKMVAANSYDVDAISGASVSSKAIKTAVKSALDKAKGISKT